MESLYLCWGWCKEKERGQLASLIGMISYKPHYKLTDLSSKCQL